LEADFTRVRLNTLLFGSDATHVVEGCRPGKAMFLGSEGCSLRYQLRVRDARSGRPWECLVLGRLFAEPAAAAAYRQTLDPLVARLDGRPDAAPFAHLAGCFDELGLVVHVFPIDSALPTLVDATDPDLMLGVLDERVRACRVELVRYGRRDRCVLRYRLGRRGPVEDEPRRMVYGKVYGDDRGERVGLMLAALRESMLALPRGDRVAVPAVVTYLPGLRLLLLDAVSGSPLLAESLRAQLSGVSLPPAARPALEQRVDGAARAAAMLHDASVPTVRTSTLDDQLLDLRQQLTDVAPFSPELALRLDALLDAVEAAAARTEPMPVCLNHGDFTFSQLLFDGAAVGLVDFDSVCLAEPALDLGQFLAYLRLDVAKHAPSGAVGETLAGALSSRFLASYALTRTRRVPERPVRDRVAVYEVVSLIRLTLHAWQKLKRARLHAALRVLQEGVTRLP
jgi:phosphotransferase family enzyme